MKRHIKRAVSAALILFTLLYTASVLTSCKQKETKIYDTLADFEGSNVGYLQGSIFDDIIDPVIDNVTYKAYIALPEEVAALQKGDIDAIALDMPVAELLVAQHPEFVIFRELVAPDQYGLVLQNNSPYTKDFTRIIEQFIADGTLDALKAKWFSGDDDIMRIDWSQYQLEDRPNGTLRYRYENTNAPMGYSGNNGEPAGFEVELVLMIADELDMGVTIDTTTIASLMNFLSTDMADVASGCISITAEREETVDFPHVSHYVGGAVLVCRRENVQAQRFSELSDFDGADIGMLIGSVLDTVVSGQVDDVTYKTYNDLTGYTSALNKGDVDAVIMDLPVAKIMVAQQPQFAIFPQMIATDTYGYILQKDSPLTDVISGAVTELWADGTIDALQEKWFSGDEDLMHIDFSQYQQGSGEGGELRYLYVNTVMPMGYTGNNGTHAGYEVELMYCIADRLNMTLVVEPTTYDALIAEITAGKADIVSGSVSITEERRESLDLTVSHYNGGVVLVCREDEIVQGKVFTDREDFSGKRLGIVEGSSLGKLMSAEIDDVEIKEYSDIAGQLAALRKGDIVGCAMDMPIAQHVIAQNPDLGMFPETIVDDSYGYILPKGHDYTAKFSDIIQQFYDNGTIDALKEKWFSGDESALVIDWSAYQTEDRPNGMITCAYVDNKVPMSFKGADGNPAGYEVELLLKIADRLDMGVTFIPTKFGSLIEYVSSGKADIGFGGVSITDERREAYDFPLSHYVGGAVIVCQREALSLDAEDGEDTDWLAGLMASFEKTFIRENRWRLIVNGLVTTLEIALFAGLFGTVLGFALCLLLRSKYRFVAWLARAWSKLIQGIPSLVVLMIIYFVIFATSSLSAVTIGILSFALMFGVSVAGILNTGINSVDKGQWEAAAALGFTKAGCFVRIILPPAIKHTLPLYVGEFVSMLKLTSIVGYISIEDLTKAGDIIRSRTYEAFFPLITTAVIYFVIASLISFFFSRLERALDPHRRPRRLPRGVTEIGDKPLAAPSKTEGTVGEELIKIEHLKKVYDNATPFFDVNTTVRRGEVITVIGPSGTGKSTLLRCINRLETPTAGTVTVFGENVCDKRTDLNKIRRKMGMVFQSFNLFGHMTVIENVMLAPVVLNKQPRQEAYENAMRLLKMVGVAEKALNYPDELSGGQKQRVAIARCLALDPEIILLDEPTSALDPTMVSEVQAVIKQLSADRYTMMIVSHEMKFVQDVSTRVFYMDEGAIYESGTPEEVFEHPRRERTRAFVKRLRTMEFVITSRDFDLYGLNGTVEEFAKKHYIAPAQVHNIQLVLEELIMNFVIGHTEDIRVNLGYFEVDSAVELTLSYGGERYDPFADTAADEISMALIKKYVSAHEHTFEESNKLVLHFVS